MTLSKEESIYGLYLGVSMSDAYLERSEAEQIQKILDRHKSNGDIDVGSINKDAVSKTVLEAYQAGTLPQLVGEMAAGLAQELSDDQKKQLCTDIKSIIDVDGRIDQVENLALDVIKERLFGVSQET